MTSNNPQDEIKKIVEKITLINVGFKVGKIDEMEKDFLVKTTLESYTSHKVVEEREKMLNILSQLREMDGDKRLSAITEFMENILLINPLQ